MMIRLFTLELHVEKPKIHMFVIPISLYIIIIVRMHLFVQVCVSSRITLEASEFP